MSADLNFGIGPAISLLCWFLRYRLPTMRKHIADGGIVAGALLIIADLMVPEMKPNVLAAGLLLIGLLFVGGALDVWLNQKPGAPVRAGSASIEPKNNMGGVSENEGIVTQGQRGDNSISK